MNLNWNLNIFIAKCLVNFYYMGNVLKHHYDIFIDYSNPNILLYLLALFKFAMKKVIYQILFFSLIISCSSESDPLRPEELTPDDVLSPKISFNSLPDIVETKTILQIFIEDKSQVHTKIYINDKLVSDSNSKEVSFEIDPFDFTIGRKNLRIVSIDLNKNETIKMVSFELKKLLFSIPKPIDEFYLEGQYLTVHFNDGSLYMTKKIEKNEDGTFYASDDFDRQEFIVSLYTSTNSTSINYHYINSYANIQPGTILLSASKKYDIFNFGNLPQSSTQLIDLREVINPRVFGYNGSLRLSGNGYYFLNYNFEAPQQFFMYSAPNPGNIKADYTYTRITDIEQTKYTKDDFIRPEDFGSIPLPGHSDFGLAIRGYETEADYLKNRYSTVLSVNGQTITTDHLDIPLFPDLFKTYQLLYSYTPDAKSRYNLHQKGIEKPILTNSFDIFKNGNNIIIKGDHDYSRIRFSYAFDRPNTYYNVFQWSFHYKSAEFVVIPFENFEIPEQVSSTFEERMALLKPSQTTSNSYTLDLEVYKHSQTIAYENMMFGSNYINNEAGDVSWLTYDLKE